MEVTKWYMNKERKDVKGTGKDGYDSRKEIASLKGKEVGRANNQKCRPLTTCIAEREGELL